MIKNNKKAFSITELIVEILIVAAIIFILAFMASPNIYPSRINDAQKECFANQRRLLTAIFEHDMDDSNMIENVFPGLDFEICEKKLLDGKYLKAPLNITHEGCSYGYIMKNSKYPTFCKVHGTLESEEKPIIPEYDKNLEKPFSPEYEALRKKIISEKTREKSLNRFFKRFREACTSPTFIGIIIFTFLLFIKVIELSLKRKNDKKMV